MACRPRGRCCSPVWHEHRRGAALGGVKVVEDGYPLRGIIRLAPGPNQPDAPAGRAPEAGEVWLDERLFAELGVNTGDKVGLGELEFRVGAMVSFEADRGANSSACCRARSST